MKSDSSFVKLFVDCFFPQNYSLKQLQITQSALFEVFFSFIIQTHKPKKKIKRLVYTQTKKETKKKIEEKTKWNQNVDQFVYVRPCKDKE